MPLEMKPAVCMLVSVLGGWRQWEYPVGSGCTANSSVSAHLYVTGALGTTDSSYLC